MDGMPKIKMPTFETVSNAFVYPYCLLINRWSFGDIMQQITTFKYLSYIKIVDDSGFRITENFL